MVKSGVETYVFASLTQAGDFPLYLSFLLCKIGTFDLHTLNELFGGLQRNYLPSRPTTVNYFLASQLPPGAPTIILPMATPGSLQTPESSRIPTTHLPWLLITFRFQPTVFPVSVTFTVYLPELSHYHSSLWFPFSSSQASPQPSDNPVTCLLLATRLLPSGQSCSAENSTSLWRGFCNETARW